METRRDEDGLTWHRIAAVQFEYRMRIVELKLELELRGAETQRVGFTLLRKRFNLTAARRTYAHL